MSTVNPTKAQIDPNVVASINTILNEVIPQKMVGQFLVVKGKSISNSTVSNWLNKSESYPDHHEWLMSAVVEHETFRKLWGDTRVFSTAQLSQFRDWLNVEAQKNGSRYPVTQRTINDHVDMLVLTGRLDRDMFKDDAGKRLDTKAFREVLAGELTLDDESGQIEEYVFKARAMIMAGYPIQDTHDIAATLAYEPEELGETA